MNEHVLIGLTGIVVLGILSQWAAWRLRIPSILVLLGIGFLAGPVAGVLHPDELLGHVLLPFVSLSVALILFEGGLSLRMRALHGVGLVLFSLITVGVVVTWVVSALAARWVLGFGWPLSVLLAAILVVTGPTVIGPLLRHLRLGGRVGSLLRWEGIVIDPIGAILAVLVFRALLIGEVGGATAAVLRVFFKTAVAGGVLGLLGAGLLWLPLRRYWIPDQLHTPVTVMMVLGIFTLSNCVQSESGLVAVTVMGVALANQRSVLMKHIINFKETLSLLLISSLFIILAARLRLQDLTGLGVESGLFVLILILVARPAGVLLSTLGSRLSWRERLFLAWMAPRGIVAASVSAIFALRLPPEQFPRAEQMVAVTFLVIIGTVLVYGLSAAPLARKLGLAEPDPHGLLIIGAHPWARNLAAALRAEKVPVLLADTSMANISAARLRGLPVYYGSVLSEHAADGLDLGDIGHLLALTPNDEVNALACVRYAEIVGRQRAYQLPFQTGSRGRWEAVAPEHRGRFLFDEKMTYADIYERFGPDPSVRATRLTQEFDYEAFLKQHGDAVLPAVLLKPTGQVELFAAGEHLVTAPGDMVFSLTK